MRTKIVCTMGPSVASLDKIQSLIDSGMNVARLNFSHGQEEEHREMIENLKKARREKKVPLAIMLDTKGPEIRVSSLSQIPLLVEPKARVYLIKNGADSLQLNPFIAIHPGEVVDHLQVGMNVLIDDGYIEGEIVECQTGYAILEIRNKGQIQIRKSLNIPHLDYHLPILSEQDKKDLAFGALYELDIVALSFVSCAEQVLEVRKYLRECHESHPLMIAKIESALGVKNFDSILAVSDGIMIARGDLGVELPIETIPKLQKQFIAKCLKMGKPVIVATQMLESMIKNPRPTRAEASDVAGAIFDSASAVMLSGETAMGNYPVEAVQMMNKIGCETEQAFDFEGYFFKLGNQHYFNVSESIACATVHSTYMTQSKMIVVCTHSGETARQIAKFRPQAKVIAITADEKTYHQLSLTWGVTPILQDVKTMKEAIEVAGNYGLKNQICQIGDLIVATSGALFGISGSTNMLVFESIGEVLVRGEANHQNEIIEGEVIKIQPKDQLARLNLSGKIILLRSCQVEDFEFLKQAKALILDDVCEDLESRRVAKMLLQEGVSSIIRAEGAYEIIRNEEIVTVDIGRGLVFKGRL